MSFHDLNPARLFAQRSLVQVAKEAYPSLPLRAIDGFRLIDGKRLWPAG
jgi:hypothetical protein